MTTSNMHETKKSSQQNRKKTPEIIFMRGSRKFCQGDPTLTGFFFVFIYLFILYLVAEGREDPNTTIRGRSSARQRNAIYMEFRWCADDGPTLNAGLAAL